MPDVGLRTVRVEIRGTATAAAVAASFVFEPVIINLVTPDSAPELRHGNPLPVDLAWIGRNPAHDRSPLFVVGFSGLALAATFIHANVRWQFRPGGLIDPFRRRRSGAAESDRDG